MNCVCLSCGKSINTFFKSYCKIKRGVFCLYCTVLTFNYSKVNHYEYIAYVRKLRVFFELHLITGCRNGQSVIMHLKLKKKTSTNRMLSILNRSLNLTQFLTKSFTYFKFCTKRTSIKAKHTHNTQNTPSHFPLSEQ